MAVTGIAVTITAVHRSARTATRAVTLDLTRKGNRYGARVVLRANTPFYTRVRVDDPSRPRFHICDARAVDAHAPSLSNPHLCSIIAMAWDNSCALV